MAYIGNTPESILQGRRATYAFTATSGQTVFSGVDDTGNILDLLQAYSNDVYLNGSRLVENDDFTISGDTLTLTVEASSNDILVITTQNEVANVASYTKAETDSRYINYNGDIVNGDLQVVGDISLGDNNKINLGADSDLQIYHTGGDSLIRDEGTGNFIISTNGTAINVMGVSNSEYMAQFVQNEDVRLYYDNSQKFATTSTGINVTGTVVADGLTVAGNSTFTASTDGTPILILESNNAGGTKENTLQFKDQGALAGDGQQIGKIEFYSSDATSAGVAGYISVLNTQSSTGEFYFGTGVSGSAVDRLNIANNGDISFYEDTGTTPKFFWDASAESLGIGTSSPPSYGSTFTVVQASNSGSGILQAQNTTNSIITEIESEGTRGAVGTRTNHDLVFKTNQTERMRLDAIDGLQIGTDAGNSGANGLHVTGTIIQGAAGLSQQQISINSGNTIQSLVLGVGYTSLKLNPLGGNVGIGTSSPAVRFHVSGSSTYVAGIEGSSAYALLGFKASGTTGTLDDANVAIGANGNTLYFRSGGVERMRLLPSGGITFNGDTAAANALDDYEEGTWTPNVWHNSSNNSTWSVIYGFYRKIGSVVYCWFRLDGGNSGTAGSQLFLTGVPFTPDASNPPAGTFGIWAANDLTPRTGNIFWTSSNVFQIYNGGNGITNQTSYMSGFFSYNA